MLVGKTDRRRVRPGERLARFMSVALPLVLVQGCSDQVGPSATASKRPVARLTSLTPQSSGFRGNVVDQPAGVLAVDANGLPVVGQSVVFQVATGSGTLAGATSVTDNTGRAQVGAWRLGPELGTQTMIATAGAASTTIEASATTPPPGRFNIDIRFRRMPSWAESTATYQAKGRWESIILSDLAPVTVPTMGPAMPGCPVTPGETISGIVVFVSFLPVDRANGVLGEADWCLARQTSGLPLIGWLTVDAEGIIPWGLLELEEVITHELGHILGIGLGPPWKLRHSGQSFTGEGARQGYLLAGGKRGGSGCNGGSVSSACQGFPPVEKLTGHWSETVFGMELMTPLLSVGRESLSAVTVLALRDMGWVVDEKEATDFILPNLLPSLAPAFGVLGRDRVGIGPVRYVDGRGEIAR